MADRSSARAFGGVFETLAEHLPEGGTRNMVASQIWTLTREYDFTPDQMNADSALFALGLARRGVHPDWPDDGVVTLYGPDGDE